MMSAMASVSASNDARNFHAFIRDEETRRLVEQLVTELMIPNAVVQRGGVEDAIRTLGRQRSPRMLLVDLTGIDLPLSAMGELAEVCEPGVTVIAIGDRNDVGLFRDLIGTGVSDYLVKPLPASILQKSLLSVVENADQARQNQRSGRLIAVIGSRGGVGSTMLATNLAWTIANRRRRRVVLVDLDLQLGTVALSLDLEPCHGLAEALEQPGRIDGLLLDRIMAQHSDTLFVLGGEEGLNEFLAPDIGALDILLKELRNKFHYVIVDLPRQISGTTQHVLNLATSLVMVTDLSLAGMRDSLRLLTMLPTINAACQITVCANRCGEHQGEITRKEFEAGIGRTIDFIVPVDNKSLGDSINRGQPIAAGRGRVAQAIHLMADHLAGGGTGSVRHSWLGRLLRR